MAETTVPAWTSDRRARGPACPVNRSRLCGQHKKPHKTELLLIAKDLEEACGFSVLVARPKTMFTICCANVPPEIEPEFLTRYGNYVKNLYDKTIMIGRSYSARVSDVITRNSGDIYEIRMGELWEKCFSDMTFGMFKAKFFHGELFEQDGANRISDRLHKSIITRILKTFVPNYINI